MNLQINKSNISNTLIGSINRKLPINLTNLRLRLDANNIRSYSGSGTTWSDISGNARNGVLTNGAVVSNNVNYGASISFDGVNDYVGGTGMNSLSTDLNGSTALTCSVWLKRSTISGAANKIFLGLSNTSGNHKVICGFTTTDTIVCGFRSANEAIQNKTTVNSFIDTNIWYNITVTVTYSTNTINIYVDGILESSTGTISFTQTTLANGTTTNNNRIGSEISSSTTCFNGLIGQVLIYNRALTAAEILQNYSADAIRFGKSSSNLFELQRQTI